MKMMKAIAEGTSSRLLDEYVFTFQDYYRESFL
jgi:hypothetical protein